MDVSFRIKHNPRFVTGESPSDCCVQLCEAIEDFCEEYGDDPAYRTACFKLKEVAQELDVIVASPGHRAALRAPQPLPSGQQILKAGETRLGPDPGSY